MISTDGIFKGGKAALGQGHQSRVSFGVNIVGWAGSEDECHLDTSSESTEANQIAILQCHMFMLCFSTVESQETLL